MKSMSDRGWYLYDRYTHQLMSFPHFRGSWRYGFATKENCRNWYLRYSDASIINEVNNYLHILDPLQSAIGEGMTRRDHSDVSNQVR
jgi:hypothetical protein